MREFSSIQHCPDCNGCVDCEHFVVDDLGPERITYMYCDFCHVGIEQLWYLVEGEWRLKHAVRYSKGTRPKRMAQFIKNMEAARVVAA